MDELTKTLFMLGVFEKLNPLEFYLRLEFCDNIEIRLDSITALFELQDNKLHIDKKEKSDYEGVSEKE